MKAPVIFFLMISLTRLTAQEPSPTVEYDIESLAEANEESAVDLQQYAEEIELLKSNPIQINFATSVELSKIPFLNVFQINNLLQYRARSGKIYSVYELGAIKGFDHETIQNILPFISFETEHAVPDLQIKKVAKYSRHSIIARSIWDLQTRKGFKTEDAYQGGKGDYLLRYKAHYRQIISWGAILQQDAGEKFGGPQNPLGVDYASANIALKNYGNWRSIVVGDYHAEFGQGLALWSSLAFAKSVNAFGIKRFAKGIKPHGGAEENRFLRGAAATYRIKSLDVSLFYSRHKVDAGIETFNPDGNPVLLSSLQYTGLHRTSTEMAKKDVIYLNMMGGNLNYKGNQFSMGATMVHYSLDKPLAQNSQPYAKFNFYGQKLTNASLDFNYIYRDINLFGELAASNNKRMAGVIGFQSNPADQFYFSLFYRNYATAYHAIYNAPFGESGKYGENGIYSGLQWNVHRFLQIKAYADFYEFKWLKFGLKSPSSGRDYTLQTDIPLSRYLHLYLRYKTEIQQVHDDTEEFIAPLTDLRRSSLRLHFSYSINRSWKLDSRIEKSFFKNSDKNESGLLIFQDVHYKPDKFGLSARFALMDSESYDTRIYAYENDLTYAFSIPPYYGKSLRFYLLGKWDFTDNLNLQLKYSITRFLDRHEISSGLNTIEGSDLSEIKVQMRLKI